jgi:hypothetical protein
MTVCYGTAVGPKKGKLWPSTEGPSREGPSKYHRWLCADISAVLPLMAEPRVNGGSNFDSLKVSAKSVRWEGSEVRINGERTMGRQRREQWTAIDEDGAFTRGSAISGRTAEIAAQSHR